MSAPRFAAFAGALGNMNNVPVGLNFRPASNPWVNRVAGFTAANYPGVQLRPPVAATATIAGRPGIGCCAGCSHDYRKA